MPPIIPEFAGNRQGNLGAESVALAQRCGYQDNCRVAPATFGVITGANTTSVTGR